MSQSLRIPILMYHSISDDPEPNFSPYYKVCTSPRRFAEHMQWLADSGYRGVTLSEGLAALADQGGAGLSPSQRKEEGANLRSFSQEDAEIAERKHESSVSSVTSCKIQYRFGVRAQQVCAPKNPILRRSHPFGGLEQEGRGRRGKSVAELVRHTGQLSVRENHIQQLLAVHRPAKLILQLPDNLPRHDVDHVSRRNIRQVPIEAHRDPVRASRGFDIGHFFRRHRPWIGTHFAACVLRGLFQRTPPGFRFAFTGS